jgi:peptidoglycan hydrolase-like protein with peptidoglycan-binding domain
MTIGVISPWPLTRQGDQGHPVQSLQYLLGARGHSVTVNGAFGPRTDAAVRAFQKENSLIADGIVGPNTWTTLIIQVKQGNQGDAVRAVQEQLRNLSGDPSKGLQVDGIFGPKTEAAVRDFQQTLSLSVPSVTVDGIVGPVTWQALISQGQPRVNWSGTPRLDPHVKGGCRKLNQVKNQLGVSDEQGKTYPGFWGVTTWQLLVNGLLPKEIDWTSVRFRATKVGSQVRVDHVALDFTAEAEISRIEWDNPQPSCIPAWTKTVGIIMDHEPKHVAIVEREVNALQRRWNGAEFRHDAADPKAADAIRAAIRQRFASEVNNLTAAIDQGFRHLEHYSECLFVDSELL